MYIIFGYSLFSLLARKKKKKKSPFSLIFQYCDCQNTKKNFLPHLSYLGTCIVIVKFFFLLLLSYSTMVLSQYKFIGQQKSQQYYCRNGFSLSSPCHIISIFSLLFFLTISATSLPKFISLLKQLNNFEHYTYHK